MTELQNISCDDCQNWLEVFVLDELPEPVRSRVANHLDGGCLDCNRRLTELVSDLALLPQLLPVHEAPPHLEHQLMSRIAAQRSPALFAPDARPSSIRSDGRPTSAVKTWAGIVVAIAAGLTGIALWIGRPARGPSVVVSGPTSWAEMERRVAEAQLSQELAPAPRMHFISRQGDTIDSGVYGHVIQDLLAHQIHLYVYDLPKIEDGRSYRLWFATADGNYLPAGIVRPDDDGAFHGLFEYPSDADEIVAVAISSEVAPDAPSPSRETLREAPL